MRDLIEREILKNILKWIPRPEIIIISGPRRAGKTSILYLLKYYLIKRERIPLKNIFYLNLEDIDILSSLNQSPKNLLKYITDDSKKNYFLIDEVQYLDNPSNFLKFLYDEYREKIKLIVTGSFLVESDKKFKDSLVGRKITFFINPLNFEEFLNFKKSDIIDYYYKKEKPVEIQKEFISLLEEHLIFGGMPEIVLTADIEMKKQLLQEYVNTYINKDIRYFWRLNSITQYNNLLKMLSSQTGNLVNVSEISNTLGINRKTVNKMVELLIDFNIIQMLPPFYTNIRTQLSKMKKVYFLDTGIRNQLINNYNSLDFRSDSGALFENFIFNELRVNIDRQNIFYFRSKNKTEIDFIINIGEKIILIETKYKKLRKKQIPRAFYYWKNKQQIHKMILVNLFFNQKEETIHFTDWTNLMKEIKTR